MSQDALCPLTNTINFFLILCSKKMFSSYFHFTFLKSNELEHLILYMKEKLYFCVCGGL